MVCCFFLVRSWRNECTIGGYVLASDFLSTTPTPLLKGVLDAGRDLEGSHGHGKGVGGVRLS